MLSVKQGGIKYNFWVFGMTQHGIEPQSPDLGESVYSDFSDGTGQVLDVAIQILVIFYTIKTIQN